MWIDLLNQAITWLVGVVGSLGYPGIFFLMFLESTFVPIPSELIVPPAGYLAAQGQMNIFLVIPIGVLGNIAGAVFSYYLSIWLGRPLLIKLLGYVRISKQHYERSEVYFRKHGEITIFISRLVLGIRHYISMPAGLARMNIRRFIFFTATGSLIWTTVLALIGYYLGYSPQVVKQYSHQLAIYTAIFCVVVIGLYVVWYRKKK